MRLAILLSALVGCGGGGGSDQGTLGGKCYPNGTCNVSLACSGGICIAAPIDAPVEPDSSPSIDAPLPDAPNDASLLCANDSAFEPNDTIATAYRTPIAIIQSSVTYANLAICPSGDKDTYHVDITQTGQNLHATVTFADGAPLGMTILNAAGTSIASGSPSNNSAFAEVLNLPTGSSPYYVQVYGMVPGQNNYSLTINVNGP